VNKVILIFLDGVGIGKTDEVNNPFFKFNFRTFTEIFGDIPSLSNSNIDCKDKFIFPTDTIMGVMELPQSGTGQTSIFCGINSQKFLGKHFGPFPHSSLHKFIKSDNIFLDALKKNKKPFFANAYPQIYFDYLEKGYSRVSVPTLCCLYSGMPLNKYENLLKGEALSPEIDNHRWVSKLKYKLPILSPEQAAFNLLLMVEKYDLVLYEYFFTDYLGHGRLKDDFKNFFNSLDLFLSAVLSNYDKNTTILIFTDHGNFEDLSLKTHTLNPGLTISAGYMAEKISKSIKDISQIKSFITNELFS